MNNSYDVYIGNLSVTVSMERLRNLFSEVGEILSIWINQEHKRVTYAFIAFYHLIDAKKASERFNNQKLDEFVIKVNLSKKTEQKLNYSVKKKTNGGILLELPKKTGCTREHSLIKILRNNLIENNEIVKDYAEAYLEAENIPFAKEFQIIKAAAETPNLSTLETTIVRYFKASCKENTLFKEVDFDISKGKVLTTEQNDKFFKISSSLN